MPDNPQRIHRPHGKHLKGNFILRSLHFPCLQLDHGQLLSYQRLLFSHSLVASHVSKWPMLFIRAWLITALSTQHHNSHICFINSGVSLPSSSVAHMGNISLMFTFAATVTLMVQSLTHLNSEFPPSVWWKVEKSQISLSGYKTK